MYLGSSTPLQTESGLFRHLQLPLQRINCAQNSATNESQVNAKVLGYVGTQLRERIALLKSLNPSQSKSQNTHFALLRHQLGI